MQDPPKRVVPRGQPRTRGAPRAPPGTRKAPVSGSREGASTPTSDAAGRPARARPGREAYGGGTPEPEAAGRPARVRGRLGDLSDGGDWAEEVGAAGRGAPGDRVLRRGDAAPAGSEAGAGGLPSVTAATAGVAPDGRVLRTEGAAAAGVVPCGRVLQGEDAVPAGAAPGDRVPQREDAVPAGAAPGDNPLQRADMAGVGAWVGAGLGAPARQRSSTASGVSADADARECENGSFLRAAGHAGTGATAVERAAPTPQGPGARNMGQAASGPVAENMAESFFQGADGQMGGTGNPGDRGPAAKGLAQGVLVDADGDVGGTRIPDKGSRRETAPGTGAKGPAKGLPRGADGEADGGANPGKDPREGAPGGQDWRAERKAQLWKLRLHHGLREMSEAAGLSPHGKKEVLIERLLAHEEAAHARGGPL